MNAKRCAGEVAHFPAGFFDNEEPAAVSMDAAAIPKASARPQAT
jgi:hypothetical protein